MIWAFVDYENVGTLEGLKLADYERVFVFCGPKNPRVKLGAPPADQFCHIELIGVSTLGRNNLDFHLAFHLGRLHEVADKATVFHLVSSDGGFDGLVNHLKKIGRSCKKISFKAVQKPDKKTIALSECAAFIVEQLKIVKEEERPKKKNGLINWIKSRCQRMNDAEPVTICKELMDASVIHLSGSNVSYDLGR